MAEQPVDRQVTPEVPWLVGSRCSRLLSLVGVDQSRIGLAKTTAFRRLLLGIVAVELWDRAVRSSGDAGYPAHVLLALLASLCVGAVFTTRAKLSRLSSSLWWTS